MVDYIEEELNDDMFRDPEDFVDDISRNEIIADLLEEKKQMQAKVDAAKIVVDGVPKVRPDRVSKLQNILKRLLDTYGTVVKYDMPVDENGLTKGFVVARYEKEESAMAALKGLNGHRLDKQHKFIVFPYTDFEKYKNYDEEWVAPEIPPLERPTCLVSWLLNDQCYDQFAILSEENHKTSIYQNCLPQPEVVEEREGWSERTIAWSPKGTFLATMHSKGAAVWGDVGFRQISRFCHPNFSFLHFSPRENYLVTMCSTNIIIWNIWLKKKMRIFTLEDNLKTATWPIFKWSHDEKYFARIGVNTLNIYETPSFGLLEKKNIAIKGIRDFEWSPSDNTLCYWVEEEDQVPGKIILMEVPSCKEIRSKNIFKMNECKIRWQEAGDYLCVLTKRYKKFKKGQNGEMRYFGHYHNIDIFSMREKLIPVQNFEFEEEVSEIAWEPVGNKLAVLHGETQKSLSFYGIKSLNTFSLLKTLEKKQCNSIFWSPDGRHIVLAGLKSLNGMFEFFDTSDFSTLSKGDHFMANDVHWDPTGRYVVTTVSWWNHKSDNGFRVWSSRGEVIRKCNEAKMCQFLWRPRPKSLLSEEKNNEIKKNLKNYSKQFVLRDRLAKSKMDREMFEKKSKLLEEFEGFRQKKKQELEELQAERQKLRSFPPQQVIQCEHLVSEKASFSLPRREWVLLNRFRTGQGRCAELMKLWGYTKDPNCACNVPQSMSHILDDCPLYKFNGGISNLHSVTPEALNWLKALPLRL
ncbi:EIF3B [Cordylochernes scorpioides]|uniref:Eukaryotic translation initiation factor 3 subunit B n=1 Tax=Cordylochernes scorpioides TaxID=51811 RepID=A0ABY6LHJ0_9ARAC|nr:EIF3B [Cordylochernes scorpioides]